MTRISKNKFEWCVALAAVLLMAATSTQAQQESGVLALEAAAGASIGGPASAQAQQEQDRLRRLEDSRWPSLDRTLDPAEKSLANFQKNTGLSLSFDYQALYQQASNSLTDVDQSASGQLRMIGNWNLVNREGENPGSLVFILENRHLLGQEIAPSGLAGEIGYAGATAVTFGDTDTTLSVAYWSQTLADGRAGLVAGRIDPGDYSDILGYVNPRTTFQTIPFCLAPFYRSQIQVSAWVAAGF
ncbi:hypothetical protein [Ruegeria atlantica]|uniref:Porin n=1 Tax=Ruegeria atlantica TaxID=81569 RepID=A0A0P1EAR6_9RHOB|nr:hypothetical protein [Ruegeria atlantica]CUH46223.1 hypothetical protein RUA4292_00388 [Ruegeria atlantica]